MQNTESKPGKYRRRADGVKRELVPSQVVHDQYRFSVRDYVGFEFSRTWLTSKQVARFLEYVGEM